jgi:hypothetical protein|tara:strand:- start:2343 stop:2603 length:261 start_codon:yes stop_codon:yes gene_type:complete
MTPQGLINVCNRPVEGLDGKPFVPEHIYLTLPKRSPPGNQVRLAGRSGPLGLVCTANEAPHGFDVVATFNRKAVVAFLKTTLKEGS